ncbi:MAG TPA: VOC family protein [Lichenihabitans sp.]|jgi:two-component system sensor histidine kinase QseC|nr:VOC family protein [Lichenihabitans sp.]
MRKITPCLWFDGNAEQAVEFYLSVFPEGRVVDTMPGPGGKALTVTFHLLGQDFIALNGGPHYKFTPAVSFFVPCESQAEIDDLWDKLLEGGSEQRCGWLTDKFGLSWQIVPTALGSLLQSQDAGGSSRAMQAMLKMKKLDIAELKRASDGG